MAGNGRNLVPHRVPTFRLTRCGGTELELPCGALVVLIAHQEEVVPCLDAVQHVQPPAGFAGEDFQPGVNAGVGKNVLQARRKWAFLATGRSDRRRGSFDNASAQARPVGPRWPRTTRRSPASRGQVLPTSPARIRNLRPRRRPRKTPWPWPAWHRGSLPPAGPQAPCTVRRKVAVLCRRYGHASQRLRRAASRNRAFRPAEHFVMSSGENQAAHLGGFAP